MGRDLPRRSGDGGGVLHTSIQSRKKLSLASRKSASLTPSTLSPPTVPIRRRPEDAVSASRQRDLEERVTELERQVAALAAAVDAASRMQVVTPRRVDQDIRLAGGRLVRRILEKGRLVEDYRETRRSG